MGLCAVHGYPRRGELSDETGGASLRCPEPARPASRDPTQRATLPSDIIYFYARYSARPAMP